MSKRIQHKLERLAELRAKQASLQAEREAEIALLLGGKLKTYRTKEARLEGSIATLENDIKEAVVKLHDSVKSPHLHAVFVPGRITWNTDALEGFRAAHPEINKFRRVGEPSVSIRAVKAESHESP